VSLTYGLCQAVDYDWCVITALVVRYNDDGDGSGEVDDGKEDDQHLTINSAIQKTVYIASTSLLPTATCQ